MARRIIETGVCEDKLRELAGYYSMDRETFIETYCLESVVPGICTNEGCDFTGEYEPDQDRGWCEECERETVASGLILAGMI